MRTAMCWDDGVTTRGPMLGRFSLFRDFLVEPPDPEVVGRLRVAENLGAPGGRHAVPRARTADEANVAATETRPGAARQHERQDGYLSAASP
jgi:hypothetical protein